MDHETDIPGTEAEAALGGDQRDGPNDPLLEVRARLDDVDELPLHARAEVFERTHEVVVEELRALELG